MKTRAQALLVVLALASARTASAQVGLNLPQPSPAASVSQTVGLTELKVSFHRPAVAGRKVWGALVPYNDVWRAGANENTTLSFSSPVKIGGKVLPAGSYGLFMIPSDKTWTVVLSNVADAWGAFGYDKRQDALRTPATPQPTSAFEERLSYRFDNPTDNAATLVMHWEKLEVPLKIEVDPQVVLSQVKGQLRGLQQFSGQAWTQAADYWLAHGGSLEEAQKFVDRASQSGDTYGTYTVRAVIAEKKGNAQEAAGLRKKALAVATEADLNRVGYGLLAQKKVDEAIAMFQKNTEAHPDSWNVYDSLAEAYLSKGEKKPAADNYKKALSLVKDDANKKRIQQTLIQLTK